MSVKEKKAKERGSSLEEMKAKPRPRKNTVGGGGDKGGWRSMGEGGWRAACPTPTSTTLPQQKMEVSRYLGESEGAEAYRVQSVDVSKIQM